MTEQQAKKFPTYKKVLLAIYVFLGFSYLHNSGLLYTYSKQPHHILLNAIRTAPADKRIFGDNVSKSIEPLLPRGMGREEALMILDDAGFTINRPSPTGTYILRKTIWTMGFVAHWYEVHLTTKDNKIETILVVKHTVAI